MASILLSTGSWVVQGLKTFRPKLQATTVFLRRMSSTRQDGTGSSSPVWSYNEWDPLEEIIVGRAEGQRVPFLNDHLKAKSTPSSWKWLEVHGGQPHDPVVLQRAAKEVEEFCRVLQHEGVTVRRPEPTPWGKLGTFQTPNYEEGGLMNCCPRDGLLVVGDEIIESAMPWRSRTFEMLSYRKLLNEYFRKGARWTAAPRPFMGDDLYVKDFPFEDEELRLKLAADGQFILTEAEVAFDAADAIRFGMDIFISLTNTTNHSGALWLQRHLEARGVRVHPLIYKGTTSSHADATFLPLKPGILLVNPVRPCLKIDNEPTGWEYFTKRGWKVVEVPEPVTVSDMVYTSKWVHMNVLSLDEERVIMQKGEEPLRRLLISLGLKPIEVEMGSAFHLGGAFHCWTLDVRRRGKLDSYLG